MPQCCWCEERVDYADVPGHECEDRPVVSL